MCVRRLLAAAVLHVSHGTELQRLCSGSRFPLPRAWLGFALQQRGPSPCRGMSLVPKCLFSLP